MRFRNHEDNERLIKRLENAVRDNRISHAYIFEGDSCIDKKSFAESFAKGILCSDGRGDNCGRCSICSKIDHGNHEDLIYVGDGEGTIKDAQIIAMQERLRTKPFGDRNIVIMNGSDTMTQRAQNRLLKTLEEPQGDAVIMLLSENMENLIQTVQSRCVKYKINHFGTDGYDFMDGTAAEIAEMALRKEPFYKLKNAADKLLREKGKTDAFLDSIEMYYRNMLVRKDNGISRYSDDEIIAAIHEIEDARRKIKQGVSVAYSIKNLLLKIGG